MDIAACNERINLIKNGTIHEPKFSNCTNLKQELKIHQKEMLYSMELLESRKLKFDNHTELETMFGVCANSTGTGKSYIIIALITNNVVLKAKTRIVKQFGNMIHLRSKPQKTRTTNIIVVPHQCVTQWTSYMECVSNLSFITICRRKHIELYINNRENHNVNPDVIILSATMYTAFFTENDHLNTNWSRIIYDEADSINISNVYQASSNFVWFITSSLQNLLFPSGQYFTTFSNGSTVRVYIEGIKHNGFIKDTFTNIERSSANPLLKHVILKHDDEHIKYSFSLIDPILNKIKCRSPIYIKMIQDLVTQDVLQALNAGDVQSAIDKIGCDTNTEENIVDVLTKVLNTKLQNINRQIQYTQEIVTTRTNEIANKERRITLLTEEKNKIEQKIDSITERISQHKEASCPICFDSYENPTVTNCCKNVFCFSCIVRSLNAVGRCPLCRSKNQGFTIIGEKKLTHNIPTKTEALMKIISENKTGKFLIFSAYDESFNIISQELDAVSIKHAKLIGPIFRINNLINQYKTGDIKILMLNSTHYGTGLNLEMTTDLIFYHKMNADMEKQVVGRAQRPGRTCQLNIHYLFQENEFKAK